MPHRHGLEGCSSPFENVTSPVVANASEGNDEASMNCVICLESMQRNLAALPCGHVFHHACVDRALASRRVCPVCRRQPKNVVRLYFSLGDADNSRSCNGKRSWDSSQTSPSRNEQQNTFALDLQQRLRELQSKLDTADDVQRMTSSHSFRLQNNLVRRQQQLEQTTEQMEKIQSDLDNARAESKKWQRIATSSYEQLRKARQDKAELERKVRTTADQMLQKIRASQQQQARYCSCSSCNEEWAEMKHVAMALASAVNARVDPCCHRHCRGSTDRHIHTDRPDASFSRGRRPRLQEHDYVL